MFQLKITLRNLRRGGIYSVVNIGGLAIGMAVAILILTWIYHEWSYDRFHTKEKQLYLAYNRASFEGKIHCWNITPLLLGSTLKTDYPEIAAVARMLDGNNMLYANGETNLKIETCHTDPDFLTMFDFPLLHGDMKTALNDPYSVILTEKTAIRLFGDEDPMGKPLLIDNQSTLTVTGIMKDLPDNTQFSLEAMTNISYLKTRGWYNDNWTANNYKTFIELHPNVRLDLVNESIRNVTNAHTDNTAQTEVFLYPLGRQHLFSRFENGIPAGGLIEKLRLFGIIAGLILLIACINFINLSTARSEKRTKEVGIRKVMGGKRFSLIGLFLKESTLIALIAGAMALLLAMIAMPIFNTLINKQLAINLNSGLFWIAGLGFVLLTGLLAGSYPAFYLSSFIPVKVLKGLFRTKQSMISPRKILVVAQFTIACALIVSTLVIHRQILYAQDRETGYSKDRLIYASLDGDVANNYELIKNDLLNSGTAVSVVKTMSPTSQGWSDTWGVEWRGKDHDARVTFDLFFTDADWAKTVGTTILEGRDIDINTFATDSSAMLLNETAVKTMNLTHPIGEIVSTQGTDWHVVGVVRDFILRSPYRPVAPLLIGGPSGWFNGMHIKLNGLNSMADNIAGTEQIFKQHNPAYPFEYRFIDEDYARKFGEEKRTGALVTWFAGLAIFISCLGLFALVAYMAETRRKEIGIRKVLGASVSGIIILLSKEFLILTLISVAVASPIAWWIMNRWLANYAYRTDIPWWLFVAVGCISLGIALLTVGFQSIKAATSNPVKAIKTE